jgi:hypothetical protein
MASINTYHAYLLTYIDLYKQALKMAYDVEKRLWDYDDAGETVTERTVGNKYKLNYFQNLRAILCQIPSVVSRAILQEHIFFSLSLLNFIILCNAYKCSHTLLDYVDSV